MDSEGHLFALHNAEVLGTADGMKLNQGIRIDKIAADIAGAAVSLGTVATQQSTSSQFWSLNDDASNPEPIVGRSVFRDLVAEIHESGRPRVLAVTGSAGSGVKFSARLLRRTLGAQVPVVEFSARELQSLSPPALSACLDRRSRDPGQCSHALAEPQRDNPEMAATRPPAMAVQAPR